jgi:type IV pilus assembly protein PilM
MAKISQQLTIDIGSTGIRMGEFEYPQAGESMILHRFKVVEYAEQITEANRHVVISDAIRSAYEEGGFTTNRCSVSVSGQAAFMRFVKLPPVREEEARIKQIVEYEARQNVPFPMDEVIWDYQLFSTGESDEDLEVMFVVIKNDIVESVIAAVKSVGLKPKIVDFAPAALYNVARANHIGEEECSMLLNIGGRCTTLLFLDGNRFFARTIPIAGFSITQQIAKEFGIGNEEAEVLKRRHGFVALGGAYEEPESEVAATISKIVRNVMTRLHGEINRSISVYRTQQKGRKPTHLYLSGGSSTMAFTDHFFSEKLRMEVGYLNPFKIVTLDPAMDIKALQEVAHMLPEVVGVGLRMSVTCPVEVTLIPESEERRIRFFQRVPWMVGAIVLWLALLVVMTLAYKRVDTLYRDATAKREQRVTALEQKRKKIERARDNQQAAIGKYQQIAGVLDSRYIWTNLLTELQLCLPQDVWLTGISQLEGPRVVAAEAEPEADAEAGLFARPTQKQDAAVESTGGEEILWFELRGSSVNIPSEKPERYLYTGEQIEALFAEVIKAQVAEGKPAAAVLGAIQQKVKVNSETESAEFFLEALRMSDYFFGGRAETTIISFNTDPDYENMKHFVIQLMLQVPISLQRE